MCDTLNNQTGVASDHRPVMALRLATGGGAALTTGYRLGSLRDKWIACDQFPSGGDAALTTGYRLGSLRDKWIACDQFFYRW